MMQRKLRLLFLFQMNEFKVVMQNLQKKTIRLICLSYLATEVKKRNFVRFCVNLESSITYLSF